MIVHILDDVMTDACIMKSLHQVCSCHFDHPEYKQRSPFICHLRHVISVGAQLDLYFCTVRSFFLFIYTHVGGDPDVTSQAGRNTLREDHWKGKSLEGFGSNQAQVTKASCLDY